MTVAAALVMFCCVGVLVPGVGTSLGRLRTGGPDTEPGADAWRCRAAPRAVAVLLLLAALSVALVRGGPGYVMAALACVGALGITRKLVRGWREREVRRRRQRAVVRLCDALSAELRAGLPLLTAAQRCCAHDPELSPVVAATRMGGDIPDTLRRCARLPGAESLRALGAAWEVAGGSGAGLATVLERLAVGLRCDDEARAEVRAALGPARATAKMLAVLPVFGIALGSSMGADPVHFLVATPWGLGCLSCGVVLALAGVWWVEAIASSAEL